MVRSAELAHARVSRAHEGGRDRDRRLDVPRVSDHADAGRGAPRNDPHRARALRGRRSRCRSGALFGARGHRSENGWKRHASRRAHPRCVPSHRLGRIDHGHLGKEVSVRHLESRDRDLQRRGQDRGSADRFPLGVSRAPPEQRERCFVERARHRNRDRDRRRSSPAISRSSVPTRCSTASRRSRERTR